jgi:hypothetical protein
VAGEYVQSQADRLGTALTTIVVVSLAVIAGAFLLGARGWTLVVIMAAALVAIAVADRRLEPAIGRWSRGAAGERKVGAILDGLGADWHVLHDVSFGRGNIDHVLVGPGGAFTVETKSHRGDIRIDRIDAHMVNQAYAEKKVLETVSGLRVQPLLVFSEAYLVGSVPAHIRGVTVLPARMLAGFLHRRRPVFDHAEAAEVGEALRLALEVDAV